MGSICCADCLPVSGMCIRWQFAKAQIVPDRRLGARSEIRPLNGDEVKYYFLGIANDKDAVGAKTVAEDLFAWFKHFSNWSTLAVYNGTTGAKANPVWLLKNLDSVQIAAALDDFKASHVITENDV